MRYFKIEPCLLLRGNSGHEINEKIKRYERNEQQSNWKVIRRVTKDEDLQKNLLISVNMDLKK